MTPRLLENTQKLRYNQFYTDISYVRVAKLHNYLKKHPQRSRIDYFFHCFQMIIILLICRYDQPFSNHNLWYTIASLTLNHDHNAKNISLIVEK